MKKYIFFDLDNTLTRSRSIITKDMTSLLLRLGKQHEIMVVSGADANQIAHQLGKNLKGKYWSMGQNGNACITPRGEVLWENKIRNTNIYEIKVLYQKAAIQ